MKQRNETNSLDGMISLGLGLFQLTIIHFENLTIRRVNEGFDVKLTPPDSMRIHLAIKDIYTGDDTYIQMKQSIVDHPLESDLELIECGCCKSKFESSDMSVFGPPICVSCHESHLQKSE